jgi:hypothetical protein
MLNAAFVADHHRQGPTSLRRKRINVRETNRRLLPPGRVGLRGPARRPKLRSDECSRRLATSTQPGRTAHQQIPQAKGVRRCESQRRGVKRGLKCRPWRTLPTPSGRPLSESLRDRILGYSNAKQRSQCSHNTNVSEHLNLSRYML